MPDTNVKIKQGIVPTPPTAPVGPDYLAPAIPAAPPLPAPVNQPKKMPARPSPRSAGSERPASPQPAVAHPAGCTHVRALRERIDRAG